MKRNSKALCLLLAGTMAVTNCPMPVMAAENDGNLTQLVSEENSAGKMANQQLTETVEETELQVSDREDSEAATAEKDLEKGKEELKEAGTEEIQEISQEVNQADETEKTDAETVEEVVDTEEVATAEKTVETEIEVLEETVNADTSLTKGDFKYTQTEDGSITITSYEGAGGTVDIAKTFAGENVVAIGNQAFQAYYSYDYNRQGRDAVSKVTLPNTLKTIGECAFWGCNGLATVSFAEGTPQLETIGAGAFNGCNALASITMPETLQSIGGKAFYGCYTLGSIIIPSSVPGIPANAFYDCYSLSRVEMKSKDTVFNSAAFGASNSNLATMKANLTFYGEADSTAEAYASEKGFRFQRYTDAITLKTPPTKTEYYYGEDLNAAGLIIEADFTSDTEPATAEIDASSCVFSGYNKNKVGTQTITVSYGDQTTTFQVKVYYNLENATVSSISNQTYTGSEITPEVTVTGKETSTTLVKDEDYTLDYDNNTDFGTASVKITGIGKYKGSITKNFNITQKSLQGKDISAAVSAVTYDGTEKEPVPVIQDGTKKLTEEDYKIISYSSNVNAGTGRIQVQGQGNYKDTLNISFTIEPKDISVYEIKDIPDQLYSKSELKPKVIVPLDEYTNLKEGTDYTVRYKDNVEIGTATVLVEGTGNYKGTIEKKFTIKAKSLKDVTVDAVPDKTYTGKAIEPELSVYDSAYGATLIKGTDYKVTYKDNVNAGTGTITIEGIGSYEGTIEKTFQINPIKINGGNTWISDMDSCTYTGEAQKPSFKLTYNYSEETILKEGTDYTVTYKDNIEAGTGTLVIEATGNYKGSITSTFEIAPKSMQAKEISASVPTVAYDGTEKKPVPVVQDGTKNLTEEDYEIVSYSSNVNAGTGKIEVQGKGNYNGILYISFIIDPKDISVYRIKDIPDQIYSKTALTPEVVVPLDEYTNLKEGIDYTVRYKDNVEIGTATVSVEGTGNYKGTIEKTFTIKAKSLKDVTVEAVPDQTYTGKAIEPVVSVYDGAYSATLIKGTDYTLTYKDNVNAGTATITIQGIGSYEGTIEKTFEIKPIKLYSDYIEISNMDTCTYTGEAQTPSFKLTYNEDTILTEGTDYTVTYKDNIEAGTGTLVIEGTGNYKGTVEKTFTILPKKLQGITINDLPGYTYTGEAVKPAIDVKMDGISLVADKDYKVTYSNNVNVGEALVSITGMGNYEGTVEKTFDIKKKSIADIGIRDIANHIYTGEAIEPVVSLELDVYTTLTKDIDYQITYVNNVNVGTATVQVQGIGNYTGVVEKTFKITPKSLAGSSVVVSGAVSNYTGKAVTPSVKVVSGNRTLIAGTEYTVTYRNNKNIGTATVTVNGIGNYTGSLSKNFTIQAKKGSTFIVGAYKYQITSGTEVAFAGLKSSKTKKVTIPTQVKIGGKTFKVTSIANKALKGSAVTSVTIGKNVKTIGTSAFEKCSKLKKITVKTSTLKKIGKNAFKGINAKAVIKVPKRKLSAYKKLMKGKGQSKTVKITK